MVALKPTFRFYINSVLHFAHLQDLYAQHVQAIASYSRVKFALFPGIHYVTAPPSSWRRGSASHLRWSRYVVDPGEECEPSLSLNFMISYPISYTKTSYGFIISPGFTQNRFFI